MVKEKNNPLKSIKDKAKKMSDKVIDYNLMDPNLTLAGAFLEGFGKFFDLYDLPSSSFNQARYFTYILQKGLKSYRDSGSKLETMEAMMNTVRFGMAELQSIVYDNSAEGYFQNTTNSCEDLSTQLSESTKFKVALIEYAESQMEQAEHQEEIENSKKNSTKITKDFLRETEKGLKRARKLADQAELAKRNPLEAGRISWKVKKEASKLRFLANKAREQADLHGTNRANRAAIKAENNAKRVENDVDRVRNAAKHARNYEGTEKKQATKNIVSSPEAIREFIKKVTYGSMALKVILKQLHSAHSSVESNWRDAQYDKFEAELNDLIKLIKNTIPAFEEYTNHLNAKAKILDDYLK